MKQDNKKKKNFFHRCVIHKFQNTFLCFFVAKTLFQIKSLEGGVFFFCYIAVFLNYLKKLYNTKKI